MGGQSFMLILLDGDGEYVEHAANPPCASGSGSFLEEQAERLGVPVKELARRAAQFSGRAPRIATRCAVFAKTDIIHAMQQGYTLDAVSAGLCEGIARSMLDVLLKGRPLCAPVGLVGGVAAEREDRLHHRDAAGRGGRDPRGLPARRGSRCRASWNRGGTSPRCAVQARDRAEIRAISPLTDPR